MVALSYANSLVLGAPGQDLPMSLAGQGGGPPDGT